MHRNVKEGLCIMKAAEFKDWIKSIERMSRGQRDKLRERLERKAGADTIIELIEQGQNDERICPYCQGTELYRWGKASELQRYRCRHCNHTFNALTGTALARIRHKDKWVDYEQAMVQGLSVRKAAISCGIFARGVAKVQAQGRSLGLLPVHAPKLYARDRAVGHFLEEGQDPCVSVLSLTQCQCIRPTSQVSSESAALPFPQPRSRRLSGSK